MRFIATRLVRLVTVLFAVAALRYLLLSFLPGDPTLALLGPASGDPVARTQLRHHLGLDRPFPIRFGDWVTKAAHGDLGHSYVTNESVLRTIGDRLPLTVELMVLSIALALIIAVPVGIASSRKPNGWFDRVSGGALFGFLALPAFMLGVLLIDIFAVQLQWLPATGVAEWFHIGHGVVATPASILLPIITLTVGQLAVFARLLRSEMLITLRSDYIMTAKSRGLSERRILLGHALRPSSFALLTVAGINIGALIGGTIIVEQLFALPGMGRLLVTSIFKRDYLVVQGCVLLISAAFVLANFCVDLLYGVLDPRVRRGGGHGG
ncbi:MAG: ABC transporter permease [Acidimicrobiales bacterium]